MSDNDNYDNMSETYNEEDYYRDDYQFQIKHNFAHPDYEGFDNEDNDDDGINNVPAAVPVIPEKSNDINVTLTNKAKYLKELLGGQDKVDLFGTPLPHLYILAKHKQAQYEHQKSINDKSNKNKSKFTNKTDGLSELMSMLVINVYTMLCVMAKHSSSKSQNKNHERYIDYGNHFNSIIALCLNNKVYFEDPTSVFHCFKNDGNQWPTYLATYIQAKKAFTEDQLLKGMFVHYYHVVTVLNIYIQSNTNI